MNRGVLDKDTESTPRLLTSILKMTIKSSVKHLRRHSKLSRSF